MNDCFFALLRVLHQPANALFDVSRRVYWPFLLVSGVIAAAVSLSRGAPWGLTARALLSPRIWLHRSALADYQLLFVKSLLRATELGSYGLSMLAVAGMTSGWLRHHAEAPGWHFAPLTVGAIYTLGAFVAEDWSRFYVHRLMHRVPVLWDFHKVHHSAEVLTPLTLYRTHPVEALLNGARSAVAVGLVTGLCAWLFGPSLRAWELLGVDALGFVWTLLGANLRHSHVWLSYGPRVERFLVSPAQHQVHHSRDAGHFNRNFGTVLAVWDWLGGSLYLTTARREALHFGLPPAEATLKHKVFSLLTEPFFALAQRLSPVTRSRLARAALFASLLPIGCTTEGTSPPRLDRAVLLQSLGRCTVDTYERFQSAADGLVTATTAYAAAPSEGSLSAARAAWERTIDLWESAELQRYGPAADRNTLGGLGLREEIYAFPDVNRCLIEQQIVSRAYATEGFARLATSTRGLAVIEYLLFSEAPDNGCEATHPINAMGTWAALTPEDLRGRKAEYARVAATHVAARGRDLLAAWEPNGFLAQLSTAGRGSALFATQQFALSAVADGAFYVDSDMKDLRIGRPLGLVRCATPTCPEALESPWADRGKRHLRSNLAGLRTLLEGCPAGNGLGFDDLLESIGASALASELRADLDAVGAAIDGIPGESLAQALRRDRASVLRVHQSLRELTDFLKMEFTVTLQISSRRVDGDHD